MSNSSPEKVAVFISDLHLTLTPPVWRSAEPNWLGVIKRVLGEVKRYSNKHGIPILYAGDLFDRWYGAHQSSELTNFLIKYMPEMYAVPGQHDIPNHSRKELHRSAFWTFVKIGRIKLLTEEPTEIIIKRKKITKNIDKIFQCKLLVYGYCYGKKILPVERTTEENTLKIAVAHQYVWIDGFGYTTAPEECKLRKRKKLLGYNVVVFGDNHKGFSTRYGSTVVYNCGGLIRRKSDEVDYRPRMGVLYSDGSVKVKYLDTSEDKYIDITREKIEEDETEMDDLVKELDLLGDASLDFVETVKQYVKTNKVRKRVENILLKSMNCG